MTRDDRTVSRWGQQFDELAGPRFAALVAYARLVSGDTTGAPDLVQDALLTSFSRIRTFDSPHAAEAYVRRAIVSRFIDSARKAGVRERALRQHAARTITHAHPPEEAVAERGISGDVGAALSALSPRERAVVVLRHVDGYSTRETAETLGISEGAVKRYLADAVARLQQTLSFTTRETARVTEAQSP